MRRRIVCTLVLVVLGAAALAAEGLVVSYVDCDAAARAGGTWVSLSAGDTVAGDATVRLIGHGVVEMKLGTLTIVLSRPGTYSVGTILAARRTEPSKKIAATLTLSFAALTTPARIDRSTASGIRAEKADTGDFDWATGDATDYLEQAKDLLAEGKLGDALVQLDRAKPEATEEQLREIAYYRASIYALQGKTREALVTLGGVAARGDEPWAADRALLEARLLIDSSAPQAAVDLLTAGSGMLAADTRRAPLYWLLLAVGNHDRGNDEAARAALAKLSALPTADGLAAAAAELIGK